MRRRLPRPRGSRPLPPRRRRTAGDRCNTNAKWRASSRRGRWPRRSSGREDADMATHTIRITVNGTPYERQVESRLLLVHFLRDQLRLTGTHIGCDTTHCGACTVLLDGEPVKSCTILTVQADG